MSRTQARVSLTMTADGPRVSLIIDGKLFTELPWQAAEALGKGLIAKAREAQEIENHEQVASDEAFARHVGLPFGLARTRAVSKEADRIAKTDDKLRRNFGHPKRGAVGTPGVYHKKDKRGKKNG